MLKHAGWTGWILLALWSLPTVAEPPPLWLRLAQAGREDPLAQTPSFAHGDEWARQVADDPLIRESVRAANHQQIARNNAELAQLLSLDQATQQRLFDLLTEQQIATTDRGTQRRPSLGRGSSEPLNQEYIEYLRLTADEHTRDYQAIRRLLGDARFQQFVDYQLLLGEHLAAAAFDSRLRAQGKLTAGQKAQLILLLREDRRVTEESQKRWQLREQARQSSRPIGQPDFDALAASQREAVESRNRLLARAPGFLTQQQTQSLGQLLQDRVVHRREVSEASRRTAGVQAPLPQASAGQVPRPIAAKLRLRIELAVNYRPPMATTLLTDSNVAVTFALGDVQVEATPKLFADGWREVDLRFYEPTPTGRRRIDSSQVPPDGLLMGFASEHTLQDMFYGAQGYAIFGKVAVSPER